MKISKKDAETLKNLFYIGESLLAEYKIFESSGELSKDRVLNLLDMEDYLLDSIDLTKDSYMAIKVGIVEKIGGFVQMSLPNALSPYMTEKTYPYIRVLSRLQLKHLSKDQSNVYSMCKSVFNDLEIGLFYGKLYDYIKTSEDSDNKFSKLITMILIDSPLVERQIVENDMQPLEYVDDAIDLQIDLWNAKYSKETFGKLCVASKSTYDVIRGKHFGKLHQDIFGLMGEYMRLHDKGQDMTSEIEICYMFLKCLIATQKKSDRDFIYKGYADEGVIDDISTHKLFVEAIEEGTVPMIRKISISNEKHIL